MIILKSFNSVLFDAKMKWQILSPDFFNFNSAAWTVYVCERWEYGLSYLWVSYRLTFSCVFTGIRYRALTGQRYAARKNVSKSSFASW